MWVEPTCGGRACCCRDYSGINSVEASCPPEPLAALEACLDCVEGEEDYVHCGSRYTTCLCVCVEGGGWHMCGMCMCIHVCGMCM